MGTTTQLIEEKIMILDSSVNREDTMAPMSVFAGVGVDYCPICGRERPFHYDSCTMPAGLTSVNPMPYGYRRWCGVVWPNCQVDTYNAELERIAVRHRAGYDTTSLVNGLYNLASQFDNA